MSKINKVNTLVSTKFVGLYEVEYKNKLNKDKKWMVASRKNKEKLEDIYFNNEEDKIDAVVICAYHKTHKKMVLIKQFRVPINDYIYELPAGLVDNEEGIYESVKRELKEETGLELININKVLSKDKLYLSPGMTDESVAFVYCTCDGEISTEYLEEDEDIEALLIDKCMAKEILIGEEKIDVKAFLQLQMFINSDENFYEI